MAKLLQTAQPLAAQASSPEGPIRPPLCEKKTLDLGLIAVFGAALWQDGHRHGRGGDFLNVK
jgi:hypothetical protein